MPNREMGPVAYGYPSPTVRSWSVPPWRYALTWVFLAGFLAVVLVLHMRDVATGTFGWFWTVLIVGLTIWNTVQHLRTAYRIDLHPDGTLAVRRPVGTVRVHVADVRRLGTTGRVNRNSTALTLRTVVDRLLVDRQIRDLPELTDAIQALNPAIGR